MKDTAPFTWILRRAESPERKSPRHHPLQSRDARPPRPTFNINEVKIDYSLVVQPCHDKPVTCERLSNTVRLRKTLLRSLAYLIPGEPRDSKPACLSAHSPAIWHNWRSASTAPHTSRVRCPHLDPWTGWTSERRVPLLGFMKHPKPIANVFEPFWLLQRDKTFPTLSSGCQRTFLPSNRLVTFPKHSRVWKVSLPFVIVQTSGSRPQASKVIETPIQTCQAAAKFAQTIASSGLITRVTRRHAPRPWGPRPMGRTSGGGRDSSFFIHTFSTSWWGPLVNKGNSWVLCLLFCWKQRESCFIFVEKSSPWTAARNCHPRPSPPWWSHSVPRRCHEHWFLQIQRTKPGNFPGLWPQPDELLSHAIRNRHWTVIPTQKSND